MLNSLGADFLHVEIVLKRRICLLTSQCFRVDVVLQGCVSLMSGQCLRVDVVLQDCIGLLTGQLLCVDFLIYSLHGLIELRMQHHVGLVFDIRWRIDVRLIPICLVNVTTHQRQNALHDVSVISQERPRWNVCLLICFYNLEHIHHAPPPRC